MNLKNKNIILTGGSSGIGKETAIQLINKGANVLITGRDEQKLHAVAAEIGAIAYAFDISELDDISSHAKQILAKLDDKVDVLINNAGIGVHKLMGDITKDDLLQVYHTNVFGLVLFTQEILPTFKNQNQGNIINIGSTSSLKGYAYGTIYSGSKFALRSITQCWQAELRKHNVRVTQINPSEVTTAFGNENRNEREEEDSKLGPTDIAHLIISTLEMRDKGFVPEVTAWATNPF